MIQILLRQPLNYWKTLEFRHKIEATLLFILMFAFFGTRLNTLLKDWIIDGATPYGVTLLISNIFSFLVGISTTATIAWLLPRQRGLITLLTLPLSKRFSIQTLSYYCFKYLSLYIILLLPTGAAIIAAINLQYALFTNLIIATNIAFFLLIQFFLRQRFLSVYSFIAGALFFQIIYYTVFALLYWVWGGAIIFQVMCIIIFNILSFYIYLFVKPNISLEKFASYQIHKYKKKVNLKSFAFKIPAVLPEKIQLLLEKELASLWRNNKYRKMKSYSLLSFLLINIIVFWTGIEHKEIWISIITCFFIWFHYTNNFNEKYIFPEPDWFMKTLPLKFRHILISKFLSEIPYAILILLMAFVSLISTGIHFQTQLIYILFITLFATFVLFIMLNFKIMFYNNIRLASYAYHFSILFFGIMIFNYRLVGPVITFLLLIFFLYKNVRYFNT